MEVKDAVKIAKTYVSELFSDENIVEIGLEEVSFNDSDNAWDVTVGFRRMSRSRKGIVGSMLPLESDEYHSRRYKLVRISNTSGKVLFVKDRELRDAA